MKKLFCIAGIVFSGLNLIDLILTLTFFNSEINPLVINNPAVFYIIKMTSTFIILTLSIYKLTEE